MSATAPREIRKKEDSPEEILYAETMHEVDGVLTISKKKDSSVSKHPKVWIFFIHAGYRINTELEVVFQNDLFFCLPRFFLRYVD